MASRMMKMILLGGGSVKYLFRDEFSLDLAAGSVNGSNCTPGIGTRIVTDSENNIIVSGGKLVVAGGLETAGLSDPFIRFSQHVTREGYPAIFYKLKYNAEGTLFSFGMSWNTTQKLITTNSDNGVSMSYGTFLILDKFLASVLIYPNTDYEFCFILKSIGFILFVRGGIFTTWTYLGSTVTGDGAVMYPSIQTMNVPLSVDEVAIVTNELDMVDDYSLTKNHIAYPTDGEITTMSPNGVIEFTWTPALSETLTIMFRRIDDDNCWKLVCGQADNSIKLYSRTAGEDTLHSVALDTQTWTAGTAYKLIIKCHDNRINVAVNNTLKNNTYFNEYNAFETGVKVTGFTTGENLNCWDWNIPIPIKRRFDTSSIQYLPYGDSKTYRDGYQYKLTQQLITATGTNWTHLDMIARSGASVESMKATIDADLAGQSQYKNPMYILSNLGSNDVTGVLDETTWKANYLYIIDAFHAKYTLAKIGLMCLWRRGYDSECTTLKTWITEIVALRSSFCFVGGDETVFLENGDNGITYTDDGIHPNVAGNTLTATAWRTSMGY